MLFAARIGNSDPVRLKLPLALSGGNTAENSFVGIPFHQYYRFGEECFS